MDFRSFSTNGGTQTGPTSAQRKWWTLKGKERAQAVESVLTLIYNNDTRRQQQYQTSARLYGNTTMMGIVGFSLNRGTQSGPAKADRLTYNVCQSAVDTITAKIAKNKPKPMFLTSGGDYRLRRKAQKLDKFVEGIFYENKAYELGTECFRDGGVLGDGMVYVFDYYGRVKYERVMVSELFVDYSESKYGKPTQMHWVKNIDRGVLKEMFPDKAAVIERANSDALDPSGRPSAIADQITVVMSWHLKSGPEAKDGSVSICIQGEELDTKEYTKDYFPFARFPWSKRLDGYWSQGGVEQIQNIQLEINKLMWVVQRSYQLAGSFKILLENGSKIVKEHLNNEVGAIINYTGTQPAYITTPIVAMECYSWLQSLISRAFEQLGISQLSAAAQKPEGLDSGKALREYNDIESDRFMTIGQAYEQFFLDLGRITVDTAKDIYEEHGEYKVMVPGKKFIQSIDWKDVDLSEDQFQMKMFPVSSLPSTPIGKLQTVKEYMQGGLVSPRTGRKLLDFPDLEQVEGLQNAPEEYLNEILDKMIYDGIYTPPEPLDDLTLAQELALEYYAQGKSSGVENEKLDLLRKFIDQVQMLIQKSMPPAPMPEMAGAAGPAQAVPMPTPQSELMPNIPGVA